MANIDALIPFHNNMIKAVPVTWYIDKIELNIVKNHLGYSYRGDVRVIWST